MGLRSPARRRRLTRVDSYRRPFAMGKQAEDVVTGFKYPIRKMVKQRGGYVSARYEDGGRDRPQTW